MAENILTKENLEKYMTNSDRTINIEIISGVPFYVLNTNDFYFTKLQGSTHILSGELATVENAVFDLWMYSERPSGINSCGLRIVYNSELNGTEGSISADTKAANTVELPYHFTRNMMHGGRLTMTMVGGKVKWLRLIPCSVQSSQNCQLYIRCDSTITEEKKQSIEKDGTASIGSIKEKQYYDKYAAVSGDTVTASFVNGGVVYTNHFYEI